jgi:hypothetical protein
MRKLAAEFNSGEFHFYLNSTDGRGDGTPEHLHDLAHTVIPLSPITPVRVDAILTTGPTWLDADLFGFLHDGVSTPGFPALQAGVLHRISVPYFTVWTADLVRARAEEIAGALNAVEGKWLCGFSRFGPGGTGPDLYRADPKAWTGNPKPCRV